MAETLDWPALMRAGTGALGLTPETFWAMTPYELRLALEGAGLLSGGVNVIDRDAFYDLMSKFPDAISDRQGAGA